VTKKKNSTAKANAEALAAAPPPSAFAGTQLSLFQAFLCNTEEERDQLSNTIELWDSIPKYAISQQAMNQIRTTEGLLPRLEKTFVYRKHEYRVRITPAILDAEEGGGDRAYYPSASEELVEDALRKIAAEQYKGFFDKPEFRSGVVFSLGMLRKELKKRGHARSYQEIIRSLQTLAGSHIEILLPEGQGFAITSFLPSLATVSRARWQEDPRFPLGGAFPSPGDPEHRYALLPPVQLPPDDVAQHPARPLAPQDALAQLRQRLLYGALPRELVFDPARQRPARVPSYQRRPAQAGKRPARAR
jgi:hypothetical protein